MNERSPCIYFLHADGDSFFAACELSHRPELRGKAVIVGGDRGIAVAMSPEAKKLGVTRGMPVFRVKKLFPEVVILDHTFGLYRTISDKMYEILSSYLDRVERYSIDECFAEVRLSDIKYFKGERALVEQIKNEIKMTLGVTYSFGLARTKSLAKLASKLDKPDGLTLLLSREEETEALKRTDIEDVWGVGWRTAPRFLQKGIKTAHDLVRLSDEDLERHFSSSHLSLKYELMGKVMKSVDHDSDPRDQKSIQSTGTFHPSSSDPKVVWAEMAENAENAAAHARTLGLLSTTVSFFVKNSDFKYRGGEVKIPLYTADPGLILNAIEPLFPKLLRVGEKIRSTGVMLHNLRKAEEVPKDLFGAQEKATEKLSIEKIADVLREKFGSGSVRRAASLQVKKRGSGSSFHA